MYIFVCSACLSNYSSPMPESPKIIIGDCRLGYNLDLSYCIDSNWSPFLTLQVVKSSYCIIPIGPVPPFRASVNRNALSEQHQSVATPF